MFMFIHKLLYLAAVIIVAIPLAGCASLGATATGERLERMRASKQHNGEHFVNKLQEADKRKKKRSFTDALGMIKRFNERDELLFPKEPLKVQALSGSDFGTPATDLTVRWLGHSTMLIELEGKRILTDPIWSDRASPVSFAGPRRFFPPLIALEDLPAIDAVVISHDHYDHLDTATIQSLNEKTGAVFFVPLGVGAHLEAWGVPLERIRELDWWEEASLGNVRFICTPARHFSGRGLDRNHTLWASWSIVGENRRVFFSGDTGLFPELEEIGERLGPFDITMLDSGAYNQRWSNSHMGPEQAVMAHRALRGKLMLPMHWGMFALAWHSAVEPIERLRVIADRDGDPIIQARPGTLLFPDEPAPVEKFWPDEKWQTAEEYPVWSTQIEPTWLQRYWPKPEGALAREAGAGEQAIP